MYLNYLSERFITMRGVDKIVMSLMSDTWRVPAGRCYQLLSDPFRCLLFRVDSGYDITANGELQ